MKNWFHGRECPTYLFFKDEAEWYGERAKEAAEREQEMMKKYFKFGLEYVKEQAEWHREQAIKEAEHKKELRK